MATNLPSCFFIQLLEQLLKFLVTFILLKYVKSQRSYCFLITKELIFGFQILDLKDHFSASLMSKSSLFAINKLYFMLICNSISGKILTIHILGAFVRGVLSGGFCPGVYVLKPLITVYTRLVKLD